jgi:hypothetical protein
MLVSSGAIVVLTAAADPWTWMVVATSLVAVVWLALTYLGGWLQRAATWMHRRPWRRDAAKEPGRSPHPPAADDPITREAFGDEGEQGADRTLHRT